MFYGSFLNQELCQLLVKRYLACQNLDELRKDADNGMIHAIESSKDEIRQTLEEMKQLMKTHKKYNEGGNITRDER